MEPKKDIKAESFQNPHKLSRRERINQTLKTTWKIILDAVFPTVCLTCHKEGRGWCCDACWAKLNFKCTLFCPACGQDDSLGRFCTNCQTSQQLAGLWCSQNYADPTVRALIHGLKYDGIKEVAKQLADILAITLKIFSLPPAWHPVPKQNWLLVPVPLSPRRECERGFNQAKVLTQLLAQNTGLSYVELLARTKFIKPQVELPHSERAQNVKNVFKIKPGAKVLNQTIILVDDVYTTGATMNECAKILKEGGALEVWGLVVAKG